MTLLTSGGSLLVLNDLPTFSIIEDTGTLVSGQAFSSKMPTAGPGYPLVIFAHGAGGDETQMTTDPTMDLITDRLAAVGFPVISGDFSGDNWGNNASRTDADELAAYGVSDLGAHATLRVWLAVSMGKTTALSWVSDGHLAETVCVASIAGVSSTQNFHDLGTEAATSVDAAFTDHAGFVAAQPTHDPTPLAAADAFAGLQTKDWYGSADGFVPPATVETLAASIGATAKLVEFTGADHATILSFLPAYTVAAYIIGSYPPTATLRNLLTV